MTEPAYRTISEVAALAGVQHHVLRFWETKFPAIAPLKRGGNRRYYRSEDVAAIQRIARLLHVEGYTIKGAQKLLAGDAVSPAAPRAATVSRPDTVRTVESPTVVAAIVPIAAITAIRADLAAALAAARAL